jgi:FKBP-type peptidyl-prolyl cis-trans isomerase SlyD
MVITHNTVATLAYTLKDPEGNIIDQASKDEPFAYLHGASNIIIGLEKELEGKVVGDTLDVTIPPEDGYGHRNEALMQEIPRSMFGDIDEKQLVPGAQFHAQTDGGFETITIASVDGDKVVIDANPALAGVTLNFVVEVLEVRDATEEEIAHGHVHAAGGCGHHH